MHVQTTPTPAPSCSSICSGVKTTPDVEQRYQPAASRDIHRLGQQMRLLNHQARLSQDLTPKGFFNRLTFFDCASEPAQHPGWALPGLSSRWCRRKRPSSVTISSIAARRWLIARRNGSAL